MTIVYNEGEGKLLFSEILAKKLKEGISEYILKVYTKDDEFEDEIFMSITPTNQTNASMEIRINEEFEAGYDMGLLASEIGSKKSIKEIAVKLRNFKSTITWYKDYDTANFPEWDNKYMRPKTKMPVCPCCLEDELSMINESTVICNYCKHGWVEDL